MSTVAAWQPGKLYPKGSLVVPRTAQTTQGTSLVNPGFEDDLSGWTVDNANLVAASDSHYTGAKSLKLGGGTNIQGNVEAVAFAACEAGKTITGGCMVNQGASSGGDAGATCWLRFYNEAKGLLSQKDGNKVDSGSNSQWKASSVSTQVPAGAKFVRIGARIYRNGSGQPLWVDDFSWNQVAPAVTSGLMYRAVQDKTGYSATTEPSWPPTLGLQVVDNEVTWEAVSVSRIVWEASPILVSGDTEPTWPTEIGASVNDNTVKWVTYDPTIADENCPQSKIVAIAKFKVYAGDGDVVRYSATLDPKDWTTAKDAGYLGTGMNQNGANKVSVLNLYRANLVVLNATTFQQWQIDPDPELMDLLDTMDGVGSKWHLAAVPVANDLFYLSNMGVRTIGVTGASNSLMSGDIGMPVDTIVKGFVEELEAINLAAGNENLQPLGLYWPSMGQYWLSFNRTVVDADSAVGRPLDVCPSLEVGYKFAEVMVYTLSQIGQVGAWSRYIFPFPIDDWTQEGDDLYVRDGDTVYRIGYDVGTMDCLLRQE